MKRMLGFCCCCAAAGSARRRYRGDRGQQTEPDVFGYPHAWLPRSAARDGPAACAHLAIAVGPICVNTLCRFGEFKFKLVRSSPPRQIPSARAPNTSDVRTALSVCVESAIRAATAVLGTPPALSNSTALRKYHGGDTESDRDNECSKHDFISRLVLDSSVRYDSTVITRLVGWRAFRRRKRRSETASSSSELGRHSAAALPLCTGRRAEILVS